MRNSIIVWILCQKISCIWKMSSSQNLRMQVAIDRIMHIKPYFKLIYYSSWYVPSYSLSMFILLFLSGYSARCRCFQPFFNLRHLASYFAVLTQSENGISHSFPPVSGTRPYPTRSLRRIVCRRQEGPIGSKGILRPILDHCFFLKSQWQPQETVMRL